MTSFRTITALLLLALVTACSTPIPGKPEVGKKAPDFTLTTLDGTRITLSDLEGKVVFVNLWATWCPPCRAEMPSLIELYRKYHDRGLEILAISEDRELGALKAFVAGNQVPFPVFQDEDKRIYGLYAATGVPETHLLDKKGVIVRSVIGSIDWTAPEVIQAVETLLAR